MSNADFVAYISAKEEGSCGSGSSTIAFAGACQMEDEYDRYRSIFSCICIIMIIQTNCWLY